MSILFVMSPVEAHQLLEERAERVADDLVEAEVELAANPGLPRLFLLDEEYRRAMYKPSCRGDKASPLRYGRPAHLG